MTLLASNALALVDWSDITTKPRTFDAAWGTVIADPRSVVVVGGHRLGKTAALEPQRQFRTSIIGRQGFGGRLTRA